MASVELIDVAKRYGKQTVLQPLDLTIPDGSFVLYWWALPAAASRPCCACWPVSKRFPAAPILMNKRPVNDLDPADRDVAMVFQSYALSPPPDGGGKSRLSYAGQKVDKQLQKSKVQQVASLLGVDKLLARYPRALPAASASGWRWAGPWSETPRFSCSMSRCRTLTPSCGWSCAQRSNPSPAHQYHHDLCHP